VFTSAEVALTSTGAPATINPKSKKMQKNQNNPKHFSLAASQDQNEEVEISKSSFVELVQTLLRDQAEKETFFKVTFIVFIS